jgi:glycosyltransferase involved in cell wall biosynthesis
MAMGRGVITTDTPGCRRTVKEGYNGWLIPPRQTQPLVEAMERMIQNPNMRKEMGQNSRIFATETFDVNRVIQPLIETLLAI